MKKNIIYTILGLTLLFSACSTDLDVTGDWKETMVVYGLLDQAKDTQYIKINKAFLGQGDATLFAQIQDSVQFANALTVKLQRIKNGIAFGTPIALMPDATIPKDPGVFYSNSQTNAIYSIYTPVGPSGLFDDSEYKLTITNSETGKVVTSQTPLVKDFNFTKPSAAASTFYFVNPTSPSWPFVVEWNSSTNGRLYQLVIRLNYKDSTTTGVVTQKHLDMQFTPLKTERLSGATEVMTVSFPGQNFLKYIATQIQPNSNIYRIAGNVELMVTGGADDLSTFIDVNKPSTGIIQERPEFTNISGGIGIFSSRYSKPSFTRPLETTSLDSLSGGQYTRCLRFLNTLGNWVNPGSCPP